MVQITPIGSRLELFVDRLLVESLERTSFKLHTPQLASREPSEFCGHYATVIHEGDRFRGYFRRYGPMYDGERYDGNPAEITCYVESTDGITWTVPELELCEVQGVGRRNNAVLAHQSPFCHNFAPFRDINPAAPPHARYKALAGVHQSARNAAGDGLHAFESADGVRWQKHHDKPVITHEGFAFDSQNVAFWSEAEGCYVCYFRTWQCRHGKMRSISRTTSPDFIHWSEPVMTDPNRPGENLYTSQAHPYFRAPHIYIALPTRYFHARGSSTDIAFMSTRAGSTHFDRLFTEAFIRPGLDPARWGNRANYAAWGVVPTGPAEISIYHGPSGLRYTLRTDGFISVHAGAGPGDVTTKPITFTGHELIVNYSTSAGGSVGVELQKPDGAPIPGFTLEDAIPLVGDAITQKVAWKHDSDLGRLAGQPVRLRFAMTEADIYSYQFR